MMATNVGARIPQSAGFGDITVLASRFKQGKRWVYFVAPTLPLMFGLVPERVDPDLVKEANRRLNEPHARAFGEYIWANDDWVSGPLSMGVKPNSMRFEELDATSGSFGLLHIPLSVLNSLSIKLFDGQHRRYGSKYAYDRAQARVADLTRQIRVAREGQQEPAVIARLEAQLRDTQQRLAELDRESVPILLYEEDDIDALRQMFSDAAKALPPDAVTVARFDMRNPYNVAAFELSKSHDLLINRVELERSTLSNRSNMLVTLNQLSNNILKTLFVGVQGRVRKRALVEPSAIVERGHAFFDDLAQAYPGLADLRDGNTEVVDLRQQNYLLMNATIQKIIAGIWYALVCEREEPREKVVQFLAESVPAEPGEGFWTQVGVLPISGVGTPLARAQEVRRSVQKAVADYIIWNSPNAAT